MTDRELNHVSSTLRNLTEDYCNNNLDASEIACLENLLQQDAATRKWFIEYVDLHSQLLWENRGESDITAHHFNVNTVINASDVFNQKKASKSIRRRNIKSYQLSKILYSFANLFEKWFSRRATLIAFSIITIISIPLIMTLLKGTRLGKPEHQAVTSNNPIAMLIALSNDGNLRNTQGKLIEVGERLPSSSITLSKGLADIQFTSGAVIRLESPSVLNLKNAWLAQLMKGKLTTDVPRAAKGFTVNTSNLNIIDLGTQFGVSVRDGNPSQVHVFEGKVKVSSDSLNIKEQLLSTGDAVELGSKGKLVKTKLDRSQFETLLSKSRDYLIWQSYAAKLRQDPDMVFYFTFEGMNDNDTQIENIAKYGSTDFAKRVGCKLIEGRYPHKKALWFNGKKDALQLNIPGEFTALTFSAWIKYEKVIHSGLVMSDGYKVKKQGLRWQYDKNGDTRLALTNDEGKERHYYARGTIKDQFANEWVHVGLTYDIISNEIKHFMNGQPAPSQVNLTNALIPISLGNCQIGNWNPAGTSQKNRPFNGTICEILMMKRAMTSYEMMQLYRKTHPAAASY